MIDSSFARQEKSNEKLTIYFDKIIDLLSDCNLAEKLIIINSLHESLRETIFNEKYYFVEEPRGGRR